MNFGFASNQFLKDCYLRGYFSLIPDHSLQVAYSSFLENLEKITEEEPDEEREQLEEKREKAK